MSQDAVLTAAAEAATEWAEEQLGYFVVPGRVTERFRPNGVLTLATRSEVISPDVSYYDASNNLVALGSGLFYDRRFRR